MDGLAYIAFSGLLNIVTWPLGGYIGDVIYRFYGTKGKKAWIIFCGFLMGAIILAGGLYIFKVVNDPAMRAVRSYLTDEKYYLKKLLIFFRSPDSHGCILSYFYFLRTGERCLFCSRTSFSPQRAYVHLNLGVELNILKIFVIFNHRFLCPALSVLLEIWAV